MPEEDATAPSDTAPKKAAPKKKAAAAAPASAKVKEGRPVGVSDDDYGKPASVHRMVIEPS